MIAVYWPPAWLAFIPIVLIEAYVGLHALKVRFGRAVLASAVANLCSTLLGIPITWFVLAMIEMLWFSSGRGFSTTAQKVYAVTVQSPWLMPDAERVAWMIPVAIAVLSVPMYLMSVLSEYAIARRFFPDVDRKQIWRWQWQANALSYGFLACLFVAMFFFGEYFNWLYKLLEPVIEFIVELIFRIATALSGSNSP